MPSSGKLADPPVTADEASVTPLSDVSVKFVCGQVGQICAVKGINLTRLKSVPTEHGKIIRAKTTAGNIVPVIGKTPEHITTLNLKEGAGSDELHIRIPIGLKFFKLKEVPAETRNAGYDSAFHYHVNDGYNVCALLYDKGSETGQNVTEIVLAVSHVPPRRKDPISDTEVEEIVPISRAELAALKKSDT